MRDIDEALQTDGYSWTENPQAPTQVKQKVVHDPMREKPRKKKKSDK